MGRVTRLMCAAESGVEFLNCDVWVEFGEQVRETSLPNVEHLSWPACENLGV